MTRKRSDGVSASRDSGDRTWQPSLRVVLVQGSSDGRDNGWRARLATEAD